MSIYNLGELFRVLIYCSVFCSYLLRKTVKPKVVRSEGIEPSPKVYETSALPSELPAQNFYDDKELTPDVVFEPTNVKAYVTICKFENYKLWCR